MSDNYLTMARIMEKGWQSWYRENVLRTNPTGFELIKLKKAYEDGFMAGFSGKYFSSES